MSDQSLSRQDRSAWHWVEEAILTAAPALLGVLLVSWVIYGERWIAAAAVFIAWLHVRVLQDRIRKGLVDAS